MKVFVEAAVPEDAEEFCRWMASTPLNLFDPGIATYPGLRTLKATINGGAAVYCPVHPVLCVESLAHRPDITPRQNAYALSKIQEALEKLAGSYGIREILWMCADESLIRLAKSRGYEEITVKVLRKKLK